MDHPRPNLDGDSEVSDRDENSSAYPDDPPCYVVRLTPLEKYKIEDVIKYLKEMDCISWIISEETKPKQHFHVVIEHEDTLKDLKLRIRTFLDTYWPPGERGRGFGNKQYNCQECKDKDLAIAYLLKDKGTYFFEGYSQEYIDHCIGMSYPKQSVSGFKQDYKELCDRYSLDSDMNIRDFIREYVLLKAKHGQQVRRQDAVAYALSAELRRNPSFSDELAGSWSETL